MEKTCIKCLKVFPLGQFHKHRKMKDGHTSICKECANQKMKEWSENNKEKKAETDRQYRLNNSEVITKKKGAWKKENKEQVNLYAREHRNKNLPLARLKDQAKMQAWRAENPDKERSARHALEASRPGEKARRLQEWRKNNPEKSRAHVNNRRSLRRGAAIADLTAAQWELIKRAYGYCCAYCGRKMQRLTQDHIIPISKNGNHTASNIVPACQSCNSRKHNGAILCQVQIILPLGL